MRHSLHRTAAAAALVVCLATLAAGAQTTLMERIQTGIDEVARGLHLVGEKAEDFVGPGLDIGENRPAAHTETRHVEERYPVAQNPIVSIVNEFGEIRIESWQERVVEVIADITVGAESAEQAAAILEAINVNVTAKEDAVEVRTALPDTRDAGGPVAIQVNYKITVPAGAGVITDNFFGDTYVKGVAGLAAVEAQYGQVELADLAGPVKVRTHGEFPLVAQRLAQGGVFQLNGAQAQFRDIDGALEISNFRGAVALADLRPGARVDATCDSGSIDLKLEANAAPDITATALHGIVEANFPITRTAQSNLVIARSPNPDAAQRIVLSAAFGDVRIERAGEDGAAARESIGERKPFNDVVTRSESLPPAGSLLIDTMPGDVRIEHAPGDQVVVTATRIVWVPAASAAPPALDALQLTAQAETDRITIGAVAAPDSTALDGARYRVDLLVQCPPDRTLEIRAAAGLTSAAGHTAALTINQAQGGIVVENCAGPLRLNNQQGDINVRDCSGDADVSVRYGTAMLSRVGGAITARAIEGRTFVDTPGGPLTVRNSGGDVRILAIEAIAGPFDIQVERGTLSLLRGPNADISLTVVVENGQVESAVPLSGNIEGKRSEFLGRLNNGAYPVRLEARDGSVLID